MDKCSILNEMLNASDTEVVLSPKKSFVSTPRVMPPVLETVLHVTSFALGLMYLMSKV